MGVFYHPSPLLLLFVADLFLFLFTQLTARFPTRPNPTYLVTQVYDGDSFQVDNLWQIRLTNVDAPEAQLCLAQDSKVHLERLIGGKRVAIKGAMTDDFGRLLSQVYLGSTLINESMIRSGLTRYTSGDFPHQERLMKLSADNKAKKIGLYSSTCLQTVNPRDPKCNIKGNVKDGHKIYFYPGCGNYSNVELSLDQGDRWFCTQGEARAAGFTKSLNCH